MNSVIPKSLKPENTNEPIPESEILALFEIKKKTIPGTVEKTTDMKASTEINERLLCPQLLILYYLLLYEDLYHTHKKLIGMFF